MASDKKQFYADLRARYAQTKELVDSYQAAYEAASMRGFVGSVRSFIFVAQQMKMLNLEGYPGIDCLTFGKWKESGYTVKKGEHSQIDGLAWIPVSKKVDGGDADSFLMPKAYNLFHRSQVTPLGENA